MVNEIKYVSNVKGIHPVFTGGYFSVIVALGDLDLNISKFHDFSNRFSKDASESGPSGCLVWIARCLLRHRHCDTQR